MSYSNTAFERAETEINARRVRAESDNARRIEDMERKIPEIKELNNQLSSTSLDIARLILRKEGNFQQM